MDRPMRIEADCLYDDASLLVLGLSPDALVRARKAGALRSVRAGRGGRAIYLGRWILDWLDRVNAGEPEAVPA